MANTKQKTKKTAPKSATSAKAAGNKAVKKTTAKKAVTKKPQAKKTPSTNSKIKVTLEQRHKMICEAAYYISLDKSYETVNPTEDWLQAEAFINKIYTIHSK